MFRKTNKSKFFQRSKKIVLKRKKVAKIFVGESGWSKIDWAYEKKSIPQVSTGLDAFLMTYDVNKIGAMKGSLSIKN